MKSKLLLIAIAVIGLTSCEDLTTIDVETTLSKTLTTEVEKEDLTGILSIKATKTDGFPFYETDVINLSENKDLKDKLDDINEMEVYNVRCKLNGIPEGEIIQELTVFSATAGLSVSLTNLTENNSTLELNVSPEVLRALGEKLLQYNEIEVGISGSSSYAPMTLSVELNFDTKANANIL